MDSDMGDIRKTVKERLETLAEPSYQQFHQSLLPGTEGILGVRMPNLRKTAKELLKQKNGEWQAYICQMEKAFENGEMLLYDEKIIWALCISGGFKSWQEVRPFILRFLPAIDNWAVCDLFCGSLKQARKAPEEAWDFICACAKSSRPYDLRFTAVMLLSHFAEEPYTEPALSLLDSIHSEEYYVKMAVAWAVSVYYVKNQKKTEAYFEHCSLDDWTYNKALQKILESYRVDKGAKEKIRSMKRRK